MNAKEFRDNLRSQYTQEHHDSETFLVGREQWELLVMERYAKHKIEEAVKQMELLEQELDDMFDRYGSNGVSRAIRILKNL